MREIKFRAWDTLYNEMIYDVQFRRDDRTFDNFLDSRYALMQFTGLHDKNGKEVWEEDKVKWIAYGPLSYEYPEEGRSEYEGIGTVIYSTENACFYIEGEEEIHSLCADFGEEEIELEVIGNIYEDKELLNNP